MIYIHLCSIIHNSFTAPKSLCASKPMATTELSSVSIAVIFPECHVVGIIQYIIFFKGTLLFFIYSWLLSVFVAARAFSSCCERGLLFVAVHGLLTAVASLVAEHGL